MDYKEWNWGAVLTRPLSVVYQDHPEFRAFVRQSLVEHLLCEAGGCFTPRERTQERRTHSTQRDHRPISGSPAARDKNDFSPSSAPLHFVREFLYLHWHKFQRKCQWVDLNQLLERKEPSAESNPAKCFCLPGGAFLWVLMEPQGPHYASSPLTGKTIFFGVVPTEFLFLNSFTFIKMPSAMWEVVKSLF